jgi:hypothetical protein
MLGAMGEAALTGEHGTSRCEPSRANADMMTEDAKFALGF